MDVGVNPGLDRPDSAGRGDVGPELAGGVLRNQPAADNHSSGRDRSVRFVIKN